MWSRIVIVLRGKYLQCINNYTKVKVVFGFFSLGMRIDHTHERRDVARRVSTKPLHISENHFHISINAFFCLNYNIQIDASFL
jgi:hypothetical protein